MLEVGPLSCVCANWELAQWPIKLILIGMLPAPNSIRKTVSSQTWAVLQTIPFYKIIFKNSKFITSQNKEHMYTLDKIYSLSFMSSSFPIYQFIAALYCNYKFERQSLTNHTYTTKLGTLQQKVQMESYWNANLIRMNMI